MAPAIFAVTNVEIEASKGLFKAQGKVMKFDGYRRVLAPVGKQEDALLPSLHESQKLDLRLPAQSWKHLLPGAIATLLGRASGSRTRDGKRSYRALGRVVGA